MNERFFHLNSEQKLLPPMLVNHLMLILPQILTKAIKIFLYLLIHRKKFKQRFI